MLAYYNENDPKAAAWLRELIKVGAIAPGTVDERSIEDVTPNDLRDFTQHHFFAGIGGWSYALRLAGWADDRPVWTGSCPCQPFSAAGSRAGTIDKRHLWPAWFHLIEICRPAIIFGEQVASKDSMPWLDIVQTDLENSNYAHATFDWPIAGVGAPHVRQRLYFVAESQSEQHDDRSRSAGPRWRQLADGSLVSRELADAYGRHASTEGLQRGGEHRLGTSDSAISPWSECDWIKCSDGKARPVEPGTFPLAHGLPARMGRIRGYGNAIAPYQAAHFIDAAMTALQRRGSHK